MVLINQLLEDWKYILVENGDLFAVMALRCLMLRISVILQLVLGM